MPESSIVEFSQSVRNVDWSFMLDGSSSSEMVATFQKMTGDLQDIHFPLKKISVSPYDKPWITEELKKMRRHRQRIYRKEGRSKAYLSVKDDFDSKRKSEVEKYIDKIKEEVSNGNRGSSYTAIRKLGNRDFTQSKSTVTFDIPELENLDDEQSAEVLADFFSSISQEFQPLAVDEFPPNMKEELEKGKYDKNIPVLEEFQVYEKSHIKLFLEI